MKNKKTKDKMKILVNLIITLMCLTKIASPAEPNHRQKRFLIVPPTAPTRHQLISGIGIPLGLAHESVTSGWVLKCQYFLPVSVNDLQWDWVFPDKINAPGTNIRKRSIAVNSTTEPYPSSTEYFDSETGEHVEKYDGKMEEIDLQSLDDHVDVAVDYAKDYVWRSKYVEDESLRNDHSRWTLYNMLEGLLNDKDMDGRECVKRVICEAAATKFGHENGILGELFHVMLSPSTTKELYSRESDEEFDRAEELGKQQKPCDFHYQKCRVSLIDIISKIL